MPRIDPVQFSDADPNVRDYMTRDESIFGKVLSTTRTYGHAPEVLRGARSLDAGITASGKISPLLRKLVNVRVAALIGCPF